MQDEGLRNNRDNTRTAEDSAETEDKEAGKATDRFFLRSTVCSYEVEEIDGGHLGAWILTHRPKPDKGWAATRAPSD